MMVYGSWNIMFEKLTCKILGHKWIMYYYSDKTIICKRCGIEKNK